MRIFIAGKQAALRNALKIFLLTRPGLEIAGMTSNKAELLSQIKVESPDLLLLDEHLEENLVTEILIPLQQLDARPFVMVLGSRLELRQAYLDAGAEAFVSKSAPPKSLLTAIEEIRLRGTSVQ